MKQESPFPNDLPVRGPPKVPAVCAPSIKKRALFQMAVRETHHCWCPGTAHVHKFTLTTLHGDCMHREESLSM
jgi:hypothetical protein